MSPRLIRWLMTDMSIGLPLMLNGLTPESEGSRVACVHRFGLGDPGDVSEARRDGDVTEVIARSSLQVRRCMKLAALVL